MFGVLPQRLYIYYFVTKSSLMLIDFIVLKIQYKNCDFSLVVCKQNDVLGYELQFFKELFTGPGIYLEKYLLCVMSLNYRNH